MSDLTETVHGTAVEIDGEGVMLRGASGSGKSDLALRLIDGGAHLISDDYVTVSEGDGGIIVSAPDAIAGKMEVRGLGVVELPVVKSARLQLIVDLSDPQDIERLPEPQYITLHGHAVRQIRCAAFEASACAKIRLACRTAVTATELA